MNIPLLSGRKRRIFVPVLAGIRDWLATDLVTITYIVKVVVACVMAMWLSLRFELDQPRTAMLTVAIVMQGRTGMVFAKSFYRLLGTSVGIVVSFILVAMFAQERVLFLVCMAVWIGMCTAGSMIFRYHQSYGFVLAGYTICIVGLPSIITPELTFSIGVTRISEIMIGLLCASLVSDLLFPQRIWEALMASIRRRFIDFSNLIVSVHAQQASGLVSPAALQRFIGDIFELESFRASSGLENDESRSYRIRLSLLNAAFMHVSTSFHSLEQLLQRQQVTGHPQVVASLLTVYQPITQAIQIDGRSARSELEAGQIVKRLRVLQAEFPQKISTARVHLSQSLSAEERLDFETGVEYLQRFIGELDEYVSAYAAMAEKNHHMIETHAIEQAPSLSMHFDGLSVALAGLRGALALLVMTCLWILLDWRSGIEAITIGVITSTLFATSPSPTRTVKQFVIGALIGTLLVYITNFQMLPEAQGFLMLTLAVIPAIVLAAWLTTKPAVATIGSGIFIIYFLHIGFNTAYSANPVTFMNDAIADLLAVMVSGVMYALIDLSTSRWSRERVSTALRELVVNACQNTQPLSRIKLETHARDLVQRIGTTRRVADLEDKKVIDWMLSTLEIGRAVTELRQHAEEVADGVLQQAIAACLAGIAELYNQPSTAHRLQAISMINEASQLGLQSTAGESMRAKLARQRLLTALHSIRCVLLDDASVLAKAAPVVMTSEGAMHAA